VFLAVGRLVIVRAEERLAVVFKEIDVLKPHGLVACEVIAGHVNRLVRMNMIQPVKMVVTIHPTKQGVTNYDGLIFAYDQY
jgi:hypothetical protein